MFHMSIQTNKPEKKEYKYIFCKSKQQTCVFLLPIRCCQFLLFTLLNWHFVVFYTFVTFVFLCLLSAVVHFVSTMLTFVEYLFFMTFEHFVYPISLNSYSLSRVRLLHSHTFTHSFYLLNGDVWLQQRQNIERKKQRKVKYKILIIQS